MLFKVMVDTSLILGATHALRESVPGWMYQRRLVALRQL